MEIIEFFFTNFWHWLGGLFYLAVIFSTPLILVCKTKKKKMSKVLSCPYLAILDGLIWHCLNGTFPINCEKCKEPKKEYVEVFSSTNASMINEK